MSKLKFSSKLLSEMTFESLSNNLLALKKELFNFRFRKALGDLADSSVILKTKKNIAKIKTEQTKRKGD